MSQITVKPLEWVSEETNWWAAQPPVMINGCGYEVRVTDSGNIRIRRGSEGWAYFDGTADEAKAFWQQEYEERITSAIHAPQSHLVGGEPVAWADFDGGQHSDPRLPRFVTSDRESAEYWQRHGRTVVPLYTAAPEPQPKEE